ncbi:sulfite exporter TauE/SafE family protein [Hyphobacterium sp. HN65]|uniref:Probable membrane transporter protein n=1 Tax=Hyphobacterium lacteum TaxID=3116575 RepID=A0ABU7LTX0_9PROT|nr:sulfite exporter TauE/SafE family protein [Hyphobacterium sp. HN65]MEE2527367.1 sulfite exporter TauE/SafE family protein [Hyphobacterium sp. HN65]
MPLIGLAALFFATALAYAMVGFGGGSTYTALLVLADTDYRILPAISLACNVTVVTGSTIRFAQAGLVPWKRLTLICAASIPMAWIGGMIHLPEQAFITLLGLALMVSAIALLVRRPAPIARHFPRWGEPLIGGGIGLLAGLVGIGGGIFLAPLMHLFRWAEARVIAASAAFFILVNSLAGLGGQLQRLAVSEADFSALLAYWPLLPAVLVGGQIGVWIARDKASDAWLIRFTAGLVLFVAVRLLWRAFSGG